METLKLKCEKLCKCVYVYVPFIYIFNAEEMLDVSDASSLCVFVVLLVFFFVKHVCLSIYIVYYFFISTILHYNY